MNSKTALFFVILLTFSSCGIKSDPIPPEGTILPSYESSFQQDKIEKDKKKKSEKKKEVIKQ